MKLFPKEQDKDFCGQNDIKPHLMVLQVLTTNVCIIITALSVEYFKPEPLCYCLTVGSA